VDTLDTADTVETVDTADMMDTLDTADTVDTVDTTDGSDVVRGGLLSLLLRRHLDEARPPTVDELHLQWRRNSRRGGGGGGVRFVRIGKSAGRKRSDIVNLYRRSLENRFVRIGK